MLDNAMGSNLQSNQTKSSLEIEGLLLKLTKTLCAYLRDTHCGDYFTLIGSHKTCFLTISHIAYLCSTLSRSKQKILIGGRWQVVLKLTLLS